MSSRKQSLITQLSSSLTELNQPFSLSAAFSSPATVVRYLDNLSYQINVQTTDSTGVFSIEVSNDYYVNEANSSVVVDEGNWIPLTLTGDLNAGVPTVAAVDTNIAISLNQVPFYATRVTYTPNVAGTGTCEIYVSDKAMG